MGHCFWHSVGLYDFRSIWPQSGAEQGCPVSKPLIIVGHGMAMVRLVDELTRCTLARYPIAVIADEPRRAYNRVHIELPAAAMSTGAHGTA